MQRRHILSILAGAFSGLLFATTAYSQPSAINFPSRPIRILVPFTPGGGTDVVVRMMAKELESELNKPVIVENRPGASTIIAAQALINAEPDGHTWFAANIDTLAANPSLYRNLPYDVNKDFRAAGLFVRWPMVLVSSNEFRAPSINKVIPMIKDQAEKLNYSSYGIGTMPHLGMELLAKHIGISLNHIPYKGSSPAVQAVVTNEVSLMMADVVTALPHIRAGKIKAHAVTMAERSKLMPELPTLQELGVEGFNIYSWTGIVVPKDVSDDVLAKISAAVQKVASSDKFTKRLSDIGGEPLNGNGDRFRKLIQNDGARLKKVINDNNIRLD